MRAPPLDRSASPESLLARYRATGDADALGALFDATAPGLFRLALSTAPDPASAEDALQETFLAVMESAHRMDPGRPVVPLLVGILKHKVEDARRRSRRAPDPRRVDPALPVGDPVDLAERSEEAERVRRAILELPETYRKAALLRWQHGLEPAEIAEILEKPPGTVWSLLSRAREMLKRALTGAVPAIGIGVIEPRGLDSIRRTVVAKAGAGAGAAVAVGGILMTKKVLAATAVLILLLGAGAQWKWGGSGSSRPVLRAEIASFTEGPAAAPKPVAKPKAAAVVATRVEDSAPPPPPAPVETPPAPRGIRKVTWPVVAGEAPVPPDGAAILLQRSPGTTEINLYKDLPAGRMAGTNLVVEGLPEKFWNATAVAPDGTVARLFVPDGTDRGNETSFRKSRRIEVVLKEEGGAPAVGERMEARNEGNNPLAPPGVSDGEGRVVFDGIQGGRANLLLLPATEERGPLIQGNWYSAVPVGTVDLEGGDSRLEVVLRPQVVLLARVTEDGKPSLPPGLVFGIQDATLRQRTDDPKAGTVRFLLRPGTKEPRIQVTATIPDQASAKAVAVWDEVEKVFVADLPLQRKPPGGTLVVRIKPPVDGRYQWQLIRLGGPRGPETIQGSAFMTFQSDFRKGPPDCPTFGGLKPGRYQFATDCGLATEPVEFGDDLSPREVSLDLSKSAYVRGRVEVPSGGDPGLAHVVVEGEGLVDTPYGGGINLRSHGGPGRIAWADGTFQVRVPGDRPVRLRAWHPSLVPALSGGTVEVEGAAEGVVLRLVEGAHAVFRMDPPAPVSSEGWQAVPTILLYRGEPIGEPVSTHIAEGKGPFRIGGYEPGTWTLFIDAPGLTPGVLRNVILSDRETDLGTIRLEEGGSVRLDLKVAAGAVAPNLHVLAWPLGGPRHSRYLNYYGKGDLVLRGLGKGPYRLTVSPSGNPMTVLLEKRVDSDGIGETALELDLR